LYIYILFMQN